MSFAELKNQINCLDFSEDGSTFATSGKDLAVRIYDTKSCQVSQHVRGVHARKARLAHPMHFIHNAWLFIKSTDNNIQALLLKINLASILFTVQIVNSIVK